MADSATGVFVFRVKAFAEQHRQFTGTTQLLVGFSGGADSTALLLILQELYRGRLTAVHLHHGLRGRAADRDAHWCEAFCATHHIPFELHRLEVSTQRQPGESLEMAARRCRLAFWTRRVPTSAAVALGHHVDDALEELFLRLGRGANASGLTGLRPRRQLQGVTFIRPLLCLRRTEIEEYLRLRDVRKWCADHTNRDLAMRRNAVRHQLLPAFQQVFGHDQGLVHTLEALYDDAAFLEAAAACRQPQELAALPPALLPRVLRRWAGHELGHEVIFTAAALNRVRRQLAQPLTAQKEITLGKGLILVLGPRQMRLVAPCRLRPRRWRWQSEPVLELPEIQARVRAEYVDTSAGAIINPAGAKHVECFLASALPEILTVRPARAGERMVPFGHRHGKKLKDLFVDAHVSHAARPATAVFLAADVVIWVPGVRRAEFGRLPRSGTHAAVRLIWENLPRPSDQL